MAIKYELQFSDSLAIQIAGNIREAIVESRLKVDEKLPTEEDLAQRFGVSRPTIREALKRLAAQNLVRSRRGPSGGTFVNRPSLEEHASALTTITALMVTMGEFSMAEIIEARHHLELTCYRLAAERRTEVHLAEMKLELETQRDPNVSDADFCASDVRFHRAMVNATENPFLQFVLVAVIEALLPIGNMVVIRFRERELIANQHQSLYEALKARDGDSAAEGLNEHMNYMREKCAEAQEWRRKRDQA
jgi:GntR family transcriptional repressor for pyruvate dehydrogenase complex